MVSGEISREDICISVCFWLPEEISTLPLVSLLHSPVLPFQLPHPCLSLSSFRQRGCLGLDFRPTGPLSLGTVGEGLPLADTLEASSHPEQDACHRLYEHIHTGSRPRTHKCDRGHHSQSRGSRMVE